MPKIKVDWDERYPDFMIVTNASFGVEIEVTDEELAFIKQADEMYGKAQAILARAKTKR